MNRLGTRERLLEAAWITLRDHGLAAATSRRITAEADANLQSITYHFGSKDALLGEALVDQLRSWSQPLADAIESAPDDPERDASIAAAVAATLARFAERGEEVQAILRVLLSDHRLPGVKEAFSAWLSDFRSLVVASMQTQQQAGLIPAQVDVHALGGVFTALGLGVIAQSDLDPDAPAITDLVAEFLQLLVRPDTPET